MHHQQNCLRFWSEATFELGHGSGQMHASRLIVYVFVYIIVTNAATSKIWQQFKQMTRHVCVCARESIKYILCVWEIESFSIFIVLRFSKCNVQYFLYCGRQLQLICTKNVKTAPALLVCMLACVCVCVIHFSLSFTLSGNNFRKLYYNCVYGKVHSVLTISKQCNKLII